MFDRKTYYLLSASLKIIIINIFFLGKKFIFRRLHIFFFISYQVFQLLRNARYIKELWQTFKKITRGYSLDFISPQYINSVYLRAPFGECKLNLINEHRDEGRRAFWRTVNNHISFIVRNSATIRDA